MVNKKVTSKKAAINASKTLKNKLSSSKSKSAAGSALSQRKAPNKQTTKSVATKASKILRDGRTSKTSKSAAGSALSQTRSVKSAPKRGTVRSTSVKRAVRTVASKRKA
jgi:hypothetical protein